MAAIKLTVDRIQPGLHIRLPLKWNDHPFLLNSFKIKDQEQVEMIRHLGVKFVYFNPEQSDASPLPANQPQVEVTQDNTLDLEAQKLWKEKQKRIEKLSAYRRRVIQCEKEFERSLARMRSVMTKIRNRPVDAVGRHNN